VRLARDRRPVRDHWEHGEARPERPPTPAEAILSLQRSAGNRAVGALLARAPEEGASAEPEAASKDAGARCTISGVAPMELASYSVGPEFDRAPGGAGGPPPPLLISATTKQGKHTPGLMQAVANATRHTVELVDRGMSWAGKEGLLVSYQTLGGPGPEPYESWEVRIDVPAPRRPGA